MPVSSRAQAQPSLSELWIHSEICQADFPPKFCAVPALLLLLCHCAWISRDFHHWSSGPRFLFQIKSLFLYLEPRNQRNLKCSELFWIFLNTAQDLRVQAMERTRHNPRVYSVLLSKVPGRRSTGWSGDSENSALERVAGRRKIGWMCRH